MTMLGTSLLNTPGCTTTRALLLAMFSTSERKFPIPQACQYREIQKPNNAQSTEKNSGAGSIWYRLTPPALRATSSLSVLMRKKVRNTDSMHAMGQMMSRKNGLR